MHITFADAIDLLCHLQQYQGDTMIYNNLSPSIVYLPEVLQAWTIYLGT